MTTLKVNCLCVLFLGKVGIKKTLKWHLYQSLHPCFQKENCQRNSARVHYLKNNSCRISNFLVSWEHCGDILSWLPKDKWFSMATQFKIDGLRGWRDGSEVKSTDCSSRGPEFNSQQPHGGSWPSIMRPGALFRHASIHGRNVVYIINK